MAVQFEKRSLLGEFKLEPDTHSLKRENVPVALTKRNDEVLFYLIE
jgi:hypothetical protein